MSYPDGSPLGTTFQAQLFRLFDDGTELPLQPTTTFQTDATDPRNRFYVKPEIIIVPDLQFPSLFEPIEIRVKVRVWEGADWQASLWRGESEEIAVLIYSVLYPPANPVGLKGFFVERQPRISGSTINGGQIQVGVSSTIAGLQTVIIERSTDLIQWSELGEFSIFNNRASFSDADFQQTGAAFFRVRFR